MAKWIAVGTLSEVTLSRRKVLDGGSWRGFHFLIILRHRVWDTNCGSLTQIIKFQRLISNENNYLLQNKTH